MHIKKTCEQSRKGASNNTATDKEIRQTILRKMLYHEFIGAKHTSIENVPKGFPKSERKRVLNITKDLAKEGYIIVKPKPDAWHVSLDPKALKKVKSEINS